MKKLSEKELKTMQDSFHILVTQLENKLRRKEGKTYIGLFSVASYLTNYYFSRCHKWTIQELDNDKLIIIKARRMFGEFSTWLISNYYEFKYPFSFSKTLQKINKELYS